MKSSEVERLYRLYGHRVFLRCLYVLKDEGRAMDITQDTYAAMLDRFLTFADDVRARAWLLKVATNRCFNELRRQRRWRTELMDEATLPAAEQMFDDPEDVLMFRRLLMSGDARDTHLLVGYFLEGKTMEEVAQESRVSEPTVRRRVKAFLERVGKLSGQDFDESK